MVEFIAIIKLSEYLSDNDYKECKFIDMVGHKDVESVYGSLFETDRGLLFMRHRWMEVNKTAKAPRVCSEMQYTFKIVTEDIWNSFKALSKEEYYTREILDEQSLSK